MNSKLEAPEPTTPSKDTPRIGVILTFVFVVMTPIAMMLVATALGRTGEDRPVEVQHAHAHGDSVEWTGDVPAPDVHLKFAADPVSGWNLHVQAEGFRFAPEQAGETHADGEGHAHLYVDGEKVARLYGPWVHLSELPEDAELITVTLNTNDHRQYVADGEPLHADVPAPSR